MLRTKLLLAIVISLALVFVMAALLYVGPDRMARQLDRSLFAHEQTEAYLRLSSDTYRHFWQLADRLILAESTEEGVPPPSRARIRNQLEELERLTYQELGLVGDHEPDERFELARLKELSDAIAAGVVAFGRVSQSPEQSDQFATLNHKIDSDFAGLISEAIADERAETLEADQRVRDLAAQLRQVAAVLSVLGVIVIGGLGYWLWRSIRGPIGELLLGTQQIASGDLGHRIRLAGRDEFAHLAGSFNGMAADLEQQRAALMVAQSDLERKVRERTSELEQANLTLTRLDEVRRRMFADISHELRTPLTIINGEAEVTLRSKTVTAEDYRTTLGRIIDLTGQVAMQVEDLMVLARSDTADLQIRRSPILARDVLQAAAEDLKALASSKNIDVEMLVPDDVDPMIDADPNRLTQLLLILVDNACRYSENGTRIAISLDQREADVLFHVTDQGVGIPTNELDAVFDRYFRGDRARHLAPRGVGLGLHVAKMIAKAHDGRLSISSEQNRGTTVTLAMPIHEADKAGDANSPD
jgi:signal transduction histidine kinase